MMCERTSTSFLANTTSFKRKGLVFDPRVGELIFEDFFLDAKKRGAVVGTKPEVYFYVQQRDRTQRPAVQHVRTEMAKDLIPFGLKHHVMTIKDVDGEILYVCERFSTMGTIFGSHDELTKRVCIFQ